jgi:two-component system alkaline phosphatase synthesis response regulator PhoP
MAKKKKILLIDDDIDIVNLVKMRLEFYDYAVMPLYTSKRVLEVVKREQPHLILMDVMMPDLNGYDACKQLKSHEKTKHIPIILFTARPEEIKKMSQEYRNIGADDYIIKPFEPTVLMDKISALIGA